MNNYYKQKFLMHGFPERSKHKYIAKVKLSNGEYRYFYKETEYRAYLATHQNKNGTRVESSNAAKYDSKGRIISEKAERFDSNGKSTTTKSKKYQYDIAGKMSHINFTETDSKKGPRNRTKYRWTRTGIPAIDEALGLKEKRWKVG
mgnify:CR=1 FL=1